MGQRNNPLEMYDFPKWGLNRGGGGGTQLLPVADKSKIEAVSGFAPDLDTHRMGASRFRRDRLRQRGMPGAGHP